MGKKKEAPPPDEYFDNLMLAVKEPSNIAQKIEMSHLVWQSPATVFETYLQDRVKELVDSIKLLDDYACQLVVDREEGEL